MIFKKLFRKKTRREFVDWLNSKIVAYNQKAPEIEDMVSLVSPTRFKIGIDEDLEGYVFLISHSLRIIMCQFLDEGGNHEDPIILEERAKIQAIIDQHRSRLEKYLGPYRDMKQEDCTSADGHRFSVAREVFRKRE